MTSIQTVLQPKQQQGSQTSSKHPPTISWPHTEPGAPGDGDKDAGAAQRKKHHCGGVWASAAGRWPGCLLPAGSCGSLCDRHAYWRSCNVHGEDVDGFIFIWKRFSKWQTNLPQGAPNSFRRGSVEWKLRNLTKGQFLHNVTFKKIQ